MLCIADINRAGHQLYRGGGAACFATNDLMWKLFSGIITAVEDCQASCPVAKPKKQRASLRIKPGMRGKPEKAHAEPKRVHKTTHSDEGL